MIKKKSITLLTVLFSLALAGCGGGGDTPSGDTSSSASGSTSEASSSSSQEPVTSDTLYVNKVSKMTDDFYRGMDVSSLLSLEAGGTKFYNFKGEEEDLLKVIADNGVNLARVRIWNNPFDSQGHGYGGGNCDINTAVAIGKRATANGVGLLANFHYSDFWADPGRQTAPKAWKNMTLEGKANALYNYTYESLTKLKDNGVDVPVVQVGNETNGFSMAGESGIESFAMLINKGYDAVKAVYPNAQVAIHFTNPEKMGYESMCNALEEHEVKYDIFGSSYYPFFHGTLANLSKQLQFPIKHGKKVMVLETQYAYTDEDTDQCGNQFSSLSSYTKNYPISIAGQANNYRNVCNAVANLKDGAGIGVCYWEGAWITASPRKKGEADVDHWTRLEEIWSKNGSGWASKYAAEYDVEAPTTYSAGTVVDNQAFFDQYGKPIESLKVFGLMQTGNTNVPEYLDGVDNTSIAYRIDETIVLPNEVDGIYNSNTRRKIPVTWETVDFDALKEQGPGTYTINGTVDQEDKHFTTKCFLTLNVANNLTNGSFEDGDDGSWTITNLRDKEFIKGTYYAMITNENSNNPITGKWDVHGFSQTERVTFKVEQEVAPFTKEMNLNLRYAMTGGSSYKFTPSDFKDHNTVYSYVLEDGVEVAKGEGYFTEYGQIVSFDISEPVHVTPGKNYTVGVYCDLNITGECPEIWFDIDDINFYQVV